MIDLDSLPGQCGRLDEGGGLREVNRSWVEAEPFEGLGARPGAGSNYLELLESCHERGIAGCARGLELVRDVLEGRESFGVLEYSCYRGTDPVYYQMIVSSAATGALLMHLDVTERIRKRRAWAHSLNNSLTAAVCYLNLALPGIPDGGEEKEFLTAAQTALNEAIQLFEGRPT